MSKREKAKFEKLLAQIAKSSGADVDDLKKEAEVGSLYSSTDNLLEAQSVYNFYKTRVEPMLDPKKERPEDFDKRFREWRIRKCVECEEEFAYAYNYEGVKFCSLDCLNKALEKIGVTLTPGRDLKKRWGPFYHPAIVPSSAFQVLKHAYEPTAPAAFDPSGKLPPNNPSHYSHPHTDDIPQSQDNQSSIS